MRMRALDLGTLFGQRTMDDLIDDLSTRADARRHWAALSALNRTRLEASRTFTGGADNDDLSVVPDVMLTLTKLASGEGVSGVITLVIADGSINTVGEAVFSDATQMFTLKWTTDGLGTSEQALAVSITGVNDIATAGAAAQDDGSARSTACH